MGGHFCLNLIISLPLTSMFRHLSSKRSSFICQVEPASGRYSAAHPPDLELRLRAHRSVAGGLNILGLLPRRCPVQYTTLAFPPPPPSNTLQLTRANLAAGGERMAGEARGRQGSTRTATRWETPLRIGGVCCRDC